MPRLGALTFTENAYETKAQDAGDGIRRRRAAAAAIKASCGAEATSSSGASIWR